VFGLVEMTDIAHLHVITGGPGSGKSTLIEALAARGFATMPEAGRAIIREEVATGGVALPWADRMAFAERMLAFEIKSYRAAATLNRPVVFDRGVPDVVGYLRVSGLPVPPRIERAARDYRYHRKVFVAPHWPEIFTNDAERKQAPDEAEATWHAMVEVYSALGYELVELPRVPVAERVAFVCAAVASPDATYFL
jgi:predicted ATPase